MQPGDNMTGYIVFAEKVVWPDIVLNNKFYHLYRLNFKMQSFAI